MTMAERVTLAPILWCLSVLIYLITLVFGDVQEPEDA